MMLAQHAACPPTLLIRCWSRIMWFVWSRGYLALGVLTVVWSSCPPLCSLVVLAPLRSLALRVTLDLSRPQWGVLLVQARSRPQWGVLLIQTRSRPTLRSRFPEERAGQNTSAACVLCVCGAEVNPAQSHNSEQSGGLVLPLEVKCRDLEYCRTEGPGRRGPYHSSPPALLEPL
ncbi:unnamed protein product [Gadus morhua 'NCC']